MIDDAPLESAKEVLLPVLEGRDPSANLVAAKCLGLMIGYDARWRNAPYLIDDVECVLTSPLYNPETNRSSRTFTLGGKLDVRATEISTGSKVVFDHKTASISTDIADPSSSYWSQLIIEGQVSQYMLLEWLNANKVDCAVWDVVRKPGISPKEVARKEREWALRDRSYFGQALSDVELEYLADTGRESPTIYAKRLAYDCTTERPERHFQRRRVPRLDSEVREYAIETWGHGQDIIAARQSGRWPRNSGACMLYGTPCKFLGICSGHDSIDSGKWTTKAWVHPELPILKGDGKDLLTNSRIRCFQTCRRKEYYEYEVGIEKLDEEEKEALFFGSLFHSAIEQYFLEMKRQQETACSVFAM